MNKNLKRYLKISLLTTIAAYLIVSFVKWDIIWIKELPSYSTFDRIGVLLCYALVHCINCVIYYTTNLLGDE